MQHTNVYTQVFCAEKSVTIVIVRELFYIGTPRILGKIKQTILRTFSRCPQSKAFDDEIKVLIPAIQN